jgi:hypothetical protein
LWIIIYISYKNDTFDALISMFQHTWSSAVLSMILIAYVQGPHYKVTIFCFPWKDRVQTDMLAHWKDNTNRMHRLGCLCKQTNENSIDMLLRIACSYEKTGCIVDESSGMHQGMVQTWLETWGVRVPRLIQTTRVATPHLGVTMYCRGAFGHKFP